MHQYTKGNDMKKVNSANGRLSGAMVPLTWIDVEKKSKNDKTEWLISNGYWINETKKATTTENVKKIKWKKRTKINTHLKNRNTV